VPSPGQTRKPLHQYPWSSVITRIKEATLTIKGRHPFQAIWGPEINPLKLPSQISDTLFPKEFLLRKIKFVKLKLNILYVFLIIYKIWFNRRPTSLG
jgi:hypothetical protein